MRILCATLILSFLMATCFVHPAVSVDYTEWSLPEGAIKRLGKGSISGNLTFSQDSSLLAVASSIGVWLYDGYTGEEINLFTNHSGYITSVAFSPDGKTLACSSSSEFYIWDIDTGNLKLTISANTGYIEDVVFSPDGKTLGTAGGYDETVELWDTSTGALIRSIDAHTDQVNCVAFSPNGKILATGGEDDEISTIKLWDTTNGELKSTLTTGSESSIYGVTDISFSPDGSKIASCDSWWYFGDTIVRIWDLVSLELQSTLKGHVKGVLSVSFSADGKTLASGGADSTICLWDVDSGLYKTTLIDHRYLINNVAFSPDGRTLASGSQDGTVILRDTENYTARTTITEHTARGTGIAFSPDGKQLATGCWDTTVRIWDISTGRNTSILRGHRGEVVSVSFSSDGHTVASSAGYSLDYDWDFADNTIRLWDVATGTQKSTIIASSDSAGAINFSPVENILTSVNNSKVILWDTTTGNSLWTVVGDEKDILRAAFSPDGRTLTINSQREVSFYDISTKQLIKSFTAPWQRYSNIAFSPNGQTIARCGSDSNVHIWNVDTGEFKTISTGHFVGYPLVSSVFGPDNRTLLTIGGGDGTIRFWDVVSGEQKVIIHGFPNGIDRIIFSPDGSKFATLGEFGTILIWDYHTIVNPYRHESDVNGDGVVDISDLVFVARNFGQTGLNAADVNGDSVVDIADLLIVAGAIDVEVGAPLATRLNFHNTFTKTEVQNLITQAQELDITEVGIQRGILFLEQLLLALTPQKTALLPNYPNPFNPETWIPYQLSESSDVKIVIYTSEGQSIRTIDLGQQSAGLYQNKAVAAYWDGKNEIGEHVASGVYFYTLTAGSYSATRRMLIRK